MQHHIDTSGLLVGAMLMAAGAFAYFTHRTRPDIVRGITHKTFLRMSIVGFICGLFVVIMAIVFPQ